MPLRVTPLDEWIKEKTGAQDRVSLLSYQLEKFRETLAYAKKNSRIYREYFKNIEPDNIKTLDDVAQVPFTTADMLADSPMDLLCVSPDAINRIVTLPTSGTTGPSKRVFFTADDQELTLDFFHRGMSLLAREGDRVMIFLPGETEGGVGDLLRRGLERLGCEGILYGPIMDYRAALQAIVESGCACVVGLPAQLFALSRIGPEIRLKSALLCSDYVSETVRRALENTWKCDVYGHYGMTETGLGGGLECSARAGYHMREADLLFEIADPATGFPAKDGESGEIVFTTLTRVGMPLIRYRTDDISRVIPEPCPCGSILRRFERVSGRIRDAIRLGNGLTLTMPMLDEIVFSAPGVIGYSAFVESAGADDGAECALTINVFSEDGVQAERAISEVVSRDAYLRNPIMDGQLKLEALKGGPEVLTYGNTKRRIIDKRR